MKQVLPMLAVAGILVATSPMQAEVNQRTFRLTAVPTVLDCIRDNSGQSPSAIVTVTRQAQNDLLQLSVNHVKPGLKFDLFTVQRSNLLSNGTVDPNFTNFGLAWYQSDLNITGNGTGTANLRTILFDQIFGFDPDVNLNPINTFHVGFWFNDPNDAAACGFNPENPTPFNGDHNAGPAAMISVPNANTGLGPLCTSPNLSTTPASCNP